MKEAKAHCVQNKQSGYVLFLKYVLSQSQEDETVDQWFLIKSVNSSMEKNILAYISVWTNCKKIHTVERLDKKEVWRILETLVRCWR